MEISSFATANQEQIFYMSLIFGAECLFIPSAWPYLDQRHRITTSALIAFVYAFTYMCVMSKSSTITANNHREQMSRYPYDHVLFRPGRTCQTCQLVKPARSKHCAICNVCVAKHDHHCIWVMNCLGRENYVFFMSLLLSLSALLSWGAYLAYGILDRILQNNLSHDDGVISSIHWSQGKTWSQYFHMLGWAFAKDFSIGGVGMLALLTAPLAYGLLFYHIYLIWAGMTTNESFKWAMWKDDITDGYVYKDGEPTDHEEQTRDLEIEPYVDWPIASNQKLFNRTEENAEHRDLVSAKWIRVKGLDEIDNIYDLGFLNNLRDALRIL